MLTDNLTHVAGPFLSLGRTWTRLSGLWQGRNLCTIATTRGCHPDPSPGELALLASMCYRQRAICVSWSSRLLPNVVVRAQAFKLLVAGPSCSLRGHICKVSAAYASSCCTQYGWKVQHEIADLGSTGLRECCTTSTILISCCWQLVSTMTFIFLQAGNWSDL